MSDDAKEWNYVVRIDDNRIKNQLDSLDRESVMNTLYS